MGVQYRGAFVSEAGVRGQGEQLICGLRSGRGWFGSDTLYNFGVPRSFVWVLGMHSVDVCNITIAFVRESSYEALLHDRLSITMPRMARVLSTGALSSFTDNEQTILMLDDWALIRIIRRAPGSELDQKFVKHSTPLPHLTSTLKSVRSAIPTRCLSNSLARSPVGRLLPRIGGYPALRTSMQR